MKCANKGQDILFYALLNHTISPAFVVFLVLQDGAFLWMLLPMRITRVCAQLIKTFLELFCFWLCINSGKWITMELLWKNFKRNSKSATKHMIRILSILICKRFQQFFSPVSCCSLLNFTRACKEHIIASRRAAVNSNNLTSKYFGIRCSVKFSFAPTFSKLEDNALCGSKEKCCYFRYLFFTKWSISGTLSRKS